MYLFPNSKSGLTTVPLKLGYGCMITFHVELLVLLLIYMS